MKNVLKMALIMSLVISLLGSSVASASEVVDLTVRASWNVPLALPNWPALVEEFNDLHPRINVHLEYITGDAATQRLRSEFITGDPPEVVQVWKTFFNEYVDAGLLREISDLYTDAGWEDGFFYPGGVRWAAPLQEAREGDSVYGIPDYVFTSVIFYNVGVFEELGIEEPTNLEELIEVSKIIRASGRMPMVGYRGTNIIDILAKVQAQTAGLQPLLDINSGTATFTDKPMLDAAMIVERLAREGVIDPVSIELDDTAAFGVARRPIWEFATRDLGIHSSRPGLSKTKPSRTFFRIR